MLQHCRGCMREICPFSGRCAPLPWLGVPRFTPAAPPLSRACAPSSGVEFPICHWRSGVFPMYLRMGCRIGGACIWWGGAWLLGNAMFSTGVGRPILPCVVVCASFQAIGTGVLSCCRCCWHAVVATVNMMGGVGLFAGDWCVPHLQASASAYTWWPAGLVSMLIIAGCFSSLVLALLPGRAKTVHAVRACYGSSPCAALMQNTMSHLLAFSIALPSCSGCAKLVPSHDLVYASLCDPQLVFHEIGPVGWDEG